MCERPRAFDGLTIRPLGRAATASRSRQIAVPPPSAATRGPVTWLERFAERFVGTVRRECLDWILIADRRHLERVLRTFVDHYNGHRPHRGLGLAALARANVVPLPSGVANIVGVSRRARLGGLINE